MNSSSRAADDLTGHPSAAAPDAHLPELTSLRFIAAFAVLVLHYRDLLGTLPAWLMRGIVGGQYGVTFFFVLSGFILSYRYHDWFASGVSEGRYWRFQRYRFARLYPVYLLGLLLDTPWHLIDRAQADQLAAVGVTYWASWLINLVGLQAWVPAVPFAMFWNTPAWSVAAEFFFYATFPFVAMGLARCVQRPRVLLALFGAAVIGGALLYALVIQLLTVVWKVNGEAQYIVLVYNPLLRYSEFFAGCVAGHWFLGRVARGGAVTASRQWQRDLLIGACLAAVALRIWMPDYTGPSREIWLFDVAVKYAAFIVPFGVLIVAIASGPSWLSPLLRQPWLVMLGEASYALYIVHWSVTSFLRLGSLGRWSTPAAHLACLLATVGVSVLVYRHIELPWRERLRGGSRPAAALPATTVAIP